MKDYIVIGAGLSGLSVAKKITDENLGSVLVLEKSRGVGGRMATRRTLGTKFDHGAQFYRAKKDISTLHQEWSEEKISHQWFVSIQGDHWCAEEGMTALAKNLAKDINVRLEFQVQTISFQDQLWKITNDKNESLLAKKIILTAPLPQSIILLEKSNIVVPVEFKKINYTKALIALITLHNDLEINQYGYEENQSGNFFSISDQKRKGVSKTPALTVTMSANFSEQEFEKSDEESLEKILQLFKEKYPEANILGAELKKWRYCQPLNNLKTMYHEIAPNLFLIGDAFGGNSLLGAVRSSDELIKNIIF
jgi:predicted NAD/FAD-dependent oxidoreductase